MSAQSSVQDIVDALSSRRALIDALIEEPMDKRDLHTALDVSRSTVDRGVRELEVLGLVKHSQSELMPTLCGRLANKEHHGSEFVNPRREDRPDRDHEFERYLHQNDIEHTLCKVGRPQSNGKIERFFQTYEKHRWRFGTPEEFLTFYNEERPHMSLDWDSLETPVETFERLVPSPAKEGSDLLATEVTVDG